ncbi:hypothetical protein VTL71DRAFT_7417 [Oculimacula yallundae]|uniref:Major facilitator superfamily (MFS) profile domain-containing protein n=1 Tax=Oculimacula yallundae TaxID=86028 RepID=A0ABR4BVQ7_9HELO
MAPVPSLDPTIRNTVESQEGSRISTPTLDEKSHDHEAAVVEPDGDDDDTRVYPQGYKLAFICLGLCIAVFLVALDNTIIATAIPKITDEFHSLDDVGWYGSAYLLTTAAFTLLFGRLYTIFPLKIVYLAAIALFELGSLICGVAPSSVALIVGRAIAGIGSAGIFSGALLIIANSAPLHKRPAYTGMMSAMYGVASVAGPLLGGAFTDKATWRWCFYINLPIGALAVIFIFFLFDSPPVSDNVRSSRTWFGLAKQLDLFGTLFFIPSIICLLLALQFGGSTYAWSDGRIIAYFVVFGVCLFIFIGFQIYFPDTASISPKIVRNRSILAGAWFAFCMGGAFFAILYYLPIWFQAVKGASAFRSGIMNIPLVLAVVVGAILSGGLVTVIGYYVPFMIASTILMSVGEGLLTTFEPSTGSSKWIGYQVICGLGIGFGMQQPLIAVQVVLPMELVPAGTALMVFCQTLGASIFVSVAQNQFQSKLISGLHHLVPELNPMVVIKAGATSLDAIVSAEFLPSVIRAYNDALAETFLVALILACLTLFGALAIEWKSVKGKQLA